ncbi:MAG: DUF3179 domain-containing protein [Acidobacteria bacterium]|nr:DUF3179 domain-containing protein [Acidobacteriota bacterium]
MSSFHVEQLSRKRHNVFRFPALLAVYGLASVLILLTAPIGASSPNTSATAQAKSDEEVPPLLQALLPNASQEQRQHALRQLARTRDKRFTAPIIDLLRFSQLRDEYLLMLQTLSVLTGKKVEEWADPWQELTVWYGAQTELKPPPGYTEWKGELHAQLIDPRFREFLYDGAMATVRVEEVVWGGVRVDGIPGLVNPRMIEASQATYLEAQEPVFGVSLNGDNRAYPLRILDWHEMANDLVGGKPVALAYCTLCGSGILYDATAGGRVHVFGSSGFLFRSNKLMYDRATKTLWNQLTGEPVIGKLTGSGTKLRVLPLVLTSWGEWKRQHPDTKVVDTNTGHERPYEIGAAYGRYFASPETMFPVWRRSRALPAKARIFAIQLDGRAKAYPLEVLHKEGGVANDTLGSRSLVVVSWNPVGRVLLPDSWRTALRRHTGRSLTYANELSAEAVQKVLQEEPPLARELTADFLLALPADDRLTLLSERTPTQRRGVGAPEGMFSPDLRNEVALRGLIGETRAYERASHMFSSTGVANELRDEQGRTWQLTEEAIVGPDAERLPRLGGHLAYWFGWFSFFPRTELYTNSSPER